MFSEHFEWPKIFECWWFYTVKNIENILCFEGFSQDFIGISLFKKMKNSRVLLSHFELTKSQKTVKKCVKREGTKKSLENRTLSRQITASSKPKKHQKSWFFTLFEANQSSLLMLKSYTKVSKNTFLNS